MSTKNSDQPLENWTISPKLKWRHRLGWLGMTILVVVSISAFIIRIRQNHETDSLADDWRNFISVGETVYWGPPYRGTRRRPVKYKVISVNEKSIVIKIEVPKNEMYPALKNEE